MYTENSQRPEQNRTLAVLADPSALAAVPRLPDIVQDDCLPSKKPCEAQRSTRQKIHVCEAKKAPVGLLSGLTVLQQQDEGTTFIIKTSQAFPAVAAAVALKSWFAMD